MFTVRETIEATRESQLHYVNVMQMLLQKNTESLCGCIQHTSTVHRRRELSKDNTFLQEPTDLLTFKHACMHTWTSAPSAAGM